MKRISVAAMILFFAMAGTSVAQKKEYRFGLSLSTLQNPVIYEIKEGAEKAAAALPNVKVLVVGAQHTTDLAGQVRQIEDFLQMKLDAIGIFALERKGIIPTIEKINKAGIPVITVDTDADGGKRECYISTDNVLGGRLGAQWIIKTFHGNAKLAILEGAPGSQANSLRMEGFMSEIKKAPGIKVVASLTANWRREDGMRVMNDILTAHPDVDVVMGINDEMALGALETLRTRGKLKQIKLVGYNGAPEAIQQVYRGNMSADVVQFQHRMGELFVQWALKLAKGERPPTDLPKTNTDPPTVHIDSGVAVVDTSLLQMRVGPALKAITNEVKFYKDM
jgi:ribose transport system substrate-binding protein